MNDLEITATSELPIPQHSSSLIMDESETTKPVEREVAMNQAEHGNQQQNGEIVFLQEASITDEVKPLVETPEVVVVSNEPAQSAQGEFCKNMLAWCR